MLDNDKVLKTYQENYQMAIEDGHGENSNRIAWEWTEEKLMHLFHRIKDQHHAAHQEAINLAFYG